MELQHYGISPKLGFLFENPLRKLPQSYYDPWETIITDIPHILTCGKARHYIEKLPELDVKYLETEAQWERAFLILTILGHSYVFQGVATGEKPKQKVPQCIAVPWVKAANHLGRQPVLSHASIVLADYFLIDPDGPVDLTNIGLINCFLGSMDERWFHLVITEVESKGAAALRSIVSARNCAAHRNVPGVAIHLRALCTVIKSMTETLLKMTDNCDPHIFFTRFRTFLSGSLVEEDFPNGLEYCGCVDENGAPLRLRLQGDSAGQSSLMPSIDAALGVQHQSDHHGKFLEDMLKYMPPRHRQFVLDLRKGQNMRDFVSRNNEKDLQEAFNSCLEALVEFRSQHLNMVALYIITQARESDLHSKEDDEVRGTGGSDILPFLRKIRSNTKNTTSKI